MAMITGKRNALKRAKMTTGNKVEYSQGKRIPPPHPPCPPEIKKIKNQIYQSQ